MEILRGSGRWRGLNRWRLLARLSKCQLSNQLSDSPLIRQIVKWYRFFLGAVPIHLFRHFCWKMYRLVTHSALRRSQTVGQTDRPTTLMTIRHYGVLKANSVQYSNKLCSSVQSTTFCKYCSFCFISALSSSSWITFSLLLKTAPAHRMRLSDVQSRPIA